METTYKDFSIGQKVKITSYQYEIFKVVGIRENEIELEGDYSAMYNVIQRDWIKIKNIVII